MLVDQEITAQESLERFRTMAKDSRTDTAGWVNSAVAKGLADKFPNGWTDLTRTMKRLLDASADVVPVPDDPSGLGWRERFLEDMNLPEFAQTLQLPFEAVQETGIHMLAVEALHSRVRRIANGNGSRWQKGF